jgi:protein arginine kinase activator
MQTKCDKCGKQATIHLTDIVDGQKNEVHLCEECAVSEGITVKSSVPISELLEDFILQKSPSAHPEETCEICGLTFSQFRQRGLLGCPHDYDAFALSLDPLLERAHEGASQHVGKVPPQASASQKKQNAILRLRGALRNAVAAEDYEKAASLRDKIKELET